MSGIYQIQSIIKPNRLYIGSSVNIYRRFLQHKKFLKNGNHHSPKLQRHYNKYSLTDLVFGVIEECKREVLLEQEQYYLDNLNPYFNVCPIAGSKTGTRLSDESRKKMSDAHKGKRLTQETRNKISQHAGHRKGANHSDESKLKMSHAKQGYVPWNKGLTKEIDERVKRNGEKISQAMRLNNCITINN
jgi:group I intron endonuclease